MLTRNPVAWALLPARWVSSRALFAAFVDLLVSNSDRKVLARQAKARLYNIATNHQRLWSWRRRAKVRQREVGWRLALWERAGKPKKRGGKQDVNTE